MLRLRPQAKACGGLRCGAHDHHDVCASYVTVCGLRSGSYSVRCGGLGVAAMLMLEGDGATPVHGPHGILMASCQIPWVAKCRWGCSGRFHVRFVGCQPAFQLIRWLDETLLRCHTSERTTLSLQGRKAKKQREEFTQKRKCKTSMQRWERMAVAAITPQTQCTRRPHCVNAHEIAVVKHCPRED